MDGFETLVGGQEVNIIMGLKDNKECRKMAPLLEKMLVEYFAKKGSMSIGILDSVYSKEEFTEAVSGGQYQMGIVLEKLNETPIGQGAIKQWKKTRPEMRIILVMDKDRYATGKVQGLYDREIYDGLFQSDFGRDAMLALIDRPRTKEEAYDYYGLKQYAEEEEKKKAAAAQKEKEVEVADDIVLQPVMGGLKKETKAGVLSLDSGVSGEENAGNAVSETETVNKTESADVLEQESTADVDVVSEDIEARVEESTADGMSVEPVDVAADSFDEGVVVEDRLAELAEDNLKDRDSKSIDGAGQVEEVVGDLVFSGSDNNVTDSSRGVSDKGLRPSASREERKSVIRQAKTVKTKSVLNFLDDKEMLKGYLDKVAASIEHVSAVHKSGKEEDNSLYAMLVKEYGFYKEEKLNDVLRGMKDREDFMYEIFDVLNEFDTDADEKTDAYMKFESFLFGYDRLERLIEMDEVQSIHVLAYDNIRVKKKDGRATANISFMEPAHYRRFVENLVQRNLKTMVREGMVSHFTDRTFSDKYVLSVSIFDSEFRVNGVKDIIIQKSVKETQMIGDLIGNRLSVEAAAIMVHAAQTRKGILFCGPRGSGVMQGMQILLNYIPFNRNGIVLQHRDELTASKHPELLVQQPVMETSTRPAYTLKQFAEDALQKDIDYYILSEVRGPEVVPFYKAMNYGYTVWSTIKAGDCEGALLTLLDSIMSANPDFNREVVAKTIADKIDYVVYMEKLEVLRIAHVKKESYNFATQRFDLVTVNSKELSAGAGK